MRSRTPKHLHPLLGARVVDWALDAARSVDPDRLVVVASADTREAYDGVDVAVQEEPRGTGDALAAARSALAGFGGSVLVVPGDSPLVREDVLRGLLDAHERAGGEATVLAFEPESPLPYGRLLRDESGALRAIVEEGDATPEQREIRELNGAVYAFRADTLWPALERLDAHNAQGELYLTDAVERLVETGASVAVYRSPDDAAPIGVNTRADYAFAASVLRRRINEAHMLAGVTIVDPESTWIDVTVELAPDVVVHPFTVLRGDTRVAEGAEIGPHAVIVGAEIGPAATIGPFCYVRPGTVLEAATKAGTFVEIKNSRIGEGAKVPHLSYVGDAEIGEETNIGAGTITGNYPHQPGRPKQRTRIGRNVRTGIHNSFVAPVEIGDDSWTAAGSVITDDVPPGSLAGFPPRQLTKEGYVYRDRNDR